MYKISPRYVFKSVFYLIPSFETMELLRSEGSGIAKTAFIYIQVYKLKYLVGVRFSGRGMLCSFRGVFPPISFEGILFNQE